MGKVGTEATLQAILAAVLGIEQKVESQEDLTYLAMLNASNYKTVMRRWFLANGCNAMADLSPLCDKWYTITRLGWTGGVRFPLPADGVSTPSDGTKTGDNAGLSCTPSTTAVANVDDYAGLPLFAPVDCNVYLDADGRPHVSAIADIAGAFDRHDPAKIVAVMQMTGWLRYQEDGSAYGWDYTDIAGAEGYYPLPEAVELADNAVRSWVVHSKYPFGDGYTCCSGVPTLVWSVSHNTQRTDVRSAWGNRYCGRTTADDAFMKLMLYLKYGQLDSDRVLHGCNSYNYTYQLAAAETGVERILLTAAQAANLLIGSTVCVGTATARTSGGATDRALVDRKRITAKETVTVDEAELVAVYIDNGGTTFDTTTDHYVYTYQWWTGTTDDVLGNDGGIDPTNDRYPVKLQGIEYMVGCYEVMGDAILSFNTIGGVECQVANVCRDATKISTSITADYKACAYGTPLPAANGWQYPRRLGFDPALPEVLHPSMVGASSTTGVRDGSYNEKVGTTGAREWLAFGHLVSGLAYAGLSCVYGYNGLTHAYWNFGGRLSLTGNRGEFQAAA